MNISRANSTKQIFISIIVPCYNVEQYLPRCLDSLVNQTLDNIEIICINDGSPDNCLNILKDYYNRYPDKIVIIDKDNEGVWRGRQDAIALARGKYIGFVDSDDYVSSNFCEHLYQAAIKTDADITVCGFHRVDFATGNILTTEMTEQRSSFNAKKNPEQLLQLNGAPWNKLFKAHLLKEMYDFEKPPRIFDDIMMHLLVYPDVESVTFVPEALIYYIIRSDSIMTTIDKSKIESTYKAMLEVRNYYATQNVSDNLMAFLDAAAFLHLGISLMFRISYDKTATLQHALKENRTYLNKYFPKWKSSKIISFSNAMRLQGPFRNIFLGRLVYKLHLMPMALQLYRLMIDKLGIDIKW